MGRRLRIVASSLVLFCGAAQAAAPEQAVPRHAQPVDQALCDVAPDEGAVRDENQQRQCRALREARIDETRRRIRERILQVIETNRQRRERAASLPPPPPAPVTVETFMQAGSLSYGDVVVTHREPLVFIGRAPEAATPEDFVAVDSPRSPHRARATQFDGAFPERNTAR